MSSTSAATSPQPLSHALPDFPWDRLSTATQVAHKYPGRVITLSVGSPVDPVPTIIQEAVSTALTVPGYPQVSGFPSLRSAISSSLARRFSMGIIQNGLELQEFSDTQILPVIGTKEFIASVVRDLGFGPQHLIGIPDLAYPTYEISAKLAQTEYITYRNADLPHDKPLSLIFINSPANPTGQVLSLDDLRAIVAYARKHHAIIISDECYLGLSWEVPAYSILDPRVHGGDTTGILAVHSTSKTSNMASYRSGYVIGDEQLIAQLLALRRHTGLMMPHIVQVATLASVKDDAHVLEQYKLYAQRRAVLKTAIEKIGFHCDHSEASLYLWATRGVDCMEEVNFFAEQGILVAPGNFYGTAGNLHIRIAFTASNADIAEASRRLAA